MDCTGTRPGNWLIDFPFGRFATRSIDEAITVILRKPTPRPNTRGRHSGWSVTRICPRPAAVIGDRVFHFVFHPAFPPAGLGKPTPAASRSAMVVHGALVPQHPGDSALPGRSSAGIHAEGTGFRRPGQEQLSCGVEHRSPIMICEPLGWRCIHPGATELQASSPRMAEDSLRAPGSRLPLDRQSY
ncbi:hypothetical protein VTN96DRAFT_543 [Rasamsonia emersonii]